MEHLEAELQTTLDHPVSAALTTLSEDVALKNGLGVLCFQSYGAEAQTVVIVILVAKTGASARETRSVGASTPRKGDLCGVDVCSRPSDMLGSILQKREMLAKRGIHVFHMDVMYVLLTRFIWM